jgi:hypothetical protein
MMCAFRSRPKLTASRSPPNSYQLIKSSVSTNSTVDTARFCPACSFAFVAHMLDTCSQPASSFSSLPIPCLGGAPPYSGLNRAAKAQMMLSKEGVMLRKPSQVSIRGMRMQEK